MNKIIDSSNTTPNRIQCTKQRILRGFFIWREMVQ